MTRSVASALTHIKRRLGRRGVVDTPQDMAPYLTDWRGRHTGKARLVALPRTTTECAAVMRLCAQAKIPLVPQGGNTGLVEGGVPSSSGQEIVISLKRMSRVLAIDAQQNTAVVEGGAVLANVQAAAESHDRLFPLSLGSEGSCTIGGTIASNAGGVHVLRFGPMRNLVLGLEVVLPNGQIWDGLRALRKDNSGYDLKHLFIGSEGTLGIITRAVLRLVPRPKTVVLTAAALSSPTQALALFSFLQTRFGEQLSAFEIMPASALTMVLRHIPNTRNPFATPPTWMVLAELWDTANIAQLERDCEEALSRAMAEGKALDAVLARSERQRHDLWKLRDSIAEAQKQDGDGIKHDISVPISSIPEFIARADAAVEKIVPHFTRVAFGHMGDGNIHYDPCPPPGMKPPLFLKRGPAITRAVNDIVVALGGSISAEHGIGATRRRELAHYKDRQSLVLYRALKSALDPQGLMNPGKLI